MWTTWASPTSGAAGLTALEGDASRRSNVEGGGILPEKALQGQEVTEVSPVRLSWLSSVFTPDSEAVHTPSLTASRTASHQQTSPDLSATSWWSTTTTTSSTTTFTPTSHSALIHSSNENQYTNNTKNLGKVYRSQVQNNLQKNQVIPIDYTHAAVESNELKYGSHTSSVSSSISSSTSTSTQWTQYLSGFTNSTDRVQHGSTGLNKVVTHFVGQDSSSTQNPDVSSLNYSGYTDTGLITNSLQYVENKSMFTGELLVDMDKLNSMHISSTKSGSPMQDIGLAGFEGLGSGEGIKTDAPYHIIGTYAWNYTVNATDKLGTSLYEDNGVEEFSLAQYLWIYVAPVILFIGLIGNVLILLVMIKGKFKGKNRMQITTVVQTSPLP